MTTRNEDIRRILESRAVAAEQNAKQKKGAKKATLENVYCKNACWPAAKRTDKG